MHTIIGAGGGIGHPLAKELNTLNKAVRLVSRSPKKVNETDECISIDAREPSNLLNAIAGSEVVYITIGFEYKLKVWQEIWPKFLKSVIDACEVHHSKLVFFDNVYMYDRNAIPHMTESSPINPCSMKGKVRAGLHYQIMEAIEKGRIEGLIARSADFYGPYNKNSALSIMVADNLIKGKKAQAFGNIDKIHTYTYTPDAAKATAILGTTSDAFNQVWHVPTTAERLSNREWIEKIATELQVKPAIQTVPVWMIKMIGLFVPIMKEFPEMMYQYEHDYFFDSSKFEKRFGLKATPSDQGIRELIASIKRA